MLCIRFIFGVFFFFTSLENILCFVPSITWCIKTMLLFPPDSTCSYLFDGPWHRVKGRLCFYVFIFIFLYLSLVHGGVVSSMAKLLGLKDCGHGIMWRGWHAMGKEIGRAINIYIYSLNGKMHGRAGLDRIKKVQSLKWSPVTVNSKISQSATPTAVAHPSVIYSHLQRKKSQPWSQNNMALNSIRADVAPSATSAQQVTQVKGRANILGCLLTGPSSLDQSCIVLRFWKNGGVLDRINLKKL